MDYTKIIDLASKISLAGLLMVILFSGYQGAWIFGSTYKDMVADRDEWKHLAMNAAHVAAEAAPQIRTATSSKDEVLRPNATKQQVSEFLSKIQRRSRYMTEPTDAPLP
jgi:hypothetical protein